MANVFRALPEAQLQRSARLTTLTGDSQALNVWARCASELPTFPLGDIFQEVAQEESVSICVDMAQFTRIVQSRRRVNLPGSHHQALIREQGRIPVDPRLSVSELRLNQAHHGLFKSHSLKEGVTKGAVGLCSPVQVSDSSTPGNLIYQASPDRLISYSLDHGREGDVVNAIDLPSNTFISPTSN